MSRGAGRARDASDQAGRRRLRGRRPRPRDGWPTRDTLWVISYDTAENADSGPPLADREPAFEVAAMGHGQPIVENGHEALPALASRLD